MREKGITLIALVITIIVLLILAGVTINLTLGEDGILKRAQQAVENYTDSREREQAKLDNFENELNGALGVVTPEDEGWNGKVNAPKIEKTGLKAVTIGDNGTINNVTDIEKDKWFDYDAKEWANAQTSEGSLWVWIPRFAYKITYTDKTVPPDKSKGGQIDVKFLQGTTNLDEEGNDVVSQGYIVHPAFEDGSKTGYPNGEWNKNITGFWMSKFEAGFEEQANATESDLTYSNNALSNYHGEITSGVTKITYPVFKANRPSYNYITIGDSFGLCKKIATAKKKDGTSLYGLSKVDTHMTKNSEWGAVAYLAWSKYGQENSEVLINNISASDEKNVLAVTGYGAIGTSTEQIKPDTTQNLTNLLAGGNRSWITEQGQKASTTGNKTGIYDMSGGLYEYTAGYIAVGDNYNTNKGSMNGLSDKYQTKYEGTSATNTENYNIETNKKRLGEALWETSSWNNDYAGFISTGDAFVIRGAHCYDGVGTGTFSFAHSDGKPYKTTGFRVVIIAE